MRSLLRKFVQDDRGLETVEYAVMGALIVAALVLAITALSSAIQNKFTGLSNTINGH